MDMVLQSNFDILINGFKYRVEVPTDCKLQYHCMCIPLHTCICSNIIHSHLFSQSLNVLYNHAVIGCHRIVSFPDSTLYEGKGSGMLNSVVSPIHASGLHVIIM